MANLKEEFIEILKKERNNSWGNSEIRKQALGIFWDKVDPVSLEDHEYKPEKIVALNGVDVRSLKQREKVFFNFMYWRTRKDKKEWTKITELINSPLYVGYETTARFSEVYSVIGELIERRKVKGKQYFEMRFKNPHESSTNNYYLTNVVEALLREKNGILPAEKSVSKAIKVFKQIYL